eukprot:1323579-Pyramimonas_sp.AAC.1
MSAHPSHASWPPRSSTEGPSGTDYTRPRHPSLHTPHTLRGPIGSSTEGLSDTIDLRPRHPCQHTPHKFRGPIGAPTK